MRSEKTHSRQTNRSVDMTLCLDSMAAEGPYRIAIYKGAVTATCSWRGLQPQRKPPWRRLLRIASESAPELATEATSETEKTLRKSIQGKVTIPERIRRAFRLFCSERGGSVLLT